MVFDREEMKNEWLKKGFQEVFVEHRKGVHMCCRGYKSPQPYFSGEGKKGDRKFHLEECCVCGFFREWPFL